MNYNRGRMYGRRRMRDIVFRAIYQYDFHNDIDITNKFLDDEISYCLLSSDLVSLAKRYLIGIIDNKSHLDQIIDESLSNWTLNRLASVDKNVLRLGTYELIYEDDVPIEVTLNEAIEIAKMYATQQDGKFVNGVLDKIAKKYAKEEKRKL
ncbi:MAG: transcription antitermination factor NusB [Thermotogota bacterium]|nr:transcription antitermination factor NusB [Thermotogota bacterium]